MVSTVGSVQLVLEAMRDDERRAVAADRLLTWQERALRGVVSVLWFTGFFVLWAVRDRFSLPWLIVVVAAWLAISISGYAALVVHQRNRARRRTRSTRRARAAGHDAHRQ